MSNPSLLPTETIKTMVHSAYDVQELRIKVGNRIAAQFRSRMQFSQIVDESLPEEERKEAEQEAEEEDTRSILVGIRRAYRTIVARGQKPNIQTFRAEFPIQTYSELCLVAQFIEIEKLEDQHFDRLGKALEDFPIYTKYLKNIVGVGPAMAGVLISEFDISKAKYPSSLWKYSGLDVKPDGRGASRRKEHLVDEEYVAADGTTKMKKSLGYNAWLKTKLVGVLATSLLRSKNPRYRKVFDEYKNRLLNNPKWRETTKGHRHAAALRYMTKIFLIDLYKAWRTLEGLPVYAPYHEAKLGLKHTEVAA